MVHVSPALITLTVLWAGILSLACFCDHYPWTAWTACSRTCNYGTQERHRAVRYDDYYWKNKCDELCVKQESRSCNIEACAVHCQLGQYGPWSVCSPCVRKQFRTRELVQPAQFGGVACSDPMVEERACHPSTECLIEQVDCGEKLTCDNGRCIDPKLRCNSQNDCGDNSDERHCVRTVKVCNRVYENLPGAELMASGYDAMADEMRAAVLDNSFFGDKCVTNRSKEDRKRYRMPANIESVQLKVEHVEDFKTDMEPAQSEPVELSSQESSLSQDAPQHWGSSIYIPLLFSSRHSWSSQGSSSFRTAVKASQQKDSKFIRIHQVVRVSTFRTKPSDLYLSEPFLRVLNSLPLDYNYALYRQVFQLFGTHYFSSGSLGGQYDLLYQYDREELKNSGLTETESSGCVQSESARHFFIFFSVSSSNNKCYTNKMSEKYEGSFLKASEKSISKVRGGRAEYAASLAMERKGVLPDSNTYRNWVNSTIDNPSVVEYELLPVLDLVRGLPCAVTKRRHLRRALQEYLEEFDSCKCAPCPNNARSVLSGTECLCVCQSGTYGPNCEQRARDYTSEVLDGRWSCWGPWSPCDSSMKRRRVRQCDNPAPMRGGLMCTGGSQQEEGCFISIFQQQDVCVSDDETVKEDPDAEISVGSPGCSRPKAPPNSYLRINKKHFNFGEMEEILCFTGFEMTGYQYVRCLPDGTWTRPDGQCIKKVCLAPVLPEDMTLHPERVEYRVGDIVTLRCTGSGMITSAQRYYTCGNDLSWDPPFPIDLHCKSEKPFVPDSRCGRGEKHDGVQCICIPREECRQYIEDVCVLDAETDRFTMMSICGFYAGRCHGDHLFFIKLGTCASDETHRDWARFRVRLSNQSRVQEPCGYDTCYDWETCTGLSSPTCECKLPRDCLRDGTRSFCVQMMKTQNRMALSACSVAALRCSGMQFSILLDTDCAA
ncbi:complement component C6 [Paramormyrops kingsleyae]|uniref:complement component C6 n=1 Tax=Paramormyrops kingsleyae TaxID=1676925 RepID=UPI003B96BBC6